MRQLFCRVLTKTGQALRLVVTKAIQAVRWVLTETGQALRRVVTKVCQAFTWVLTRQIRIRTPAQTSGGDVVGKPQSQDSPVFSDTRDYCIDIPVDNDDDHRVVALREPLLSEDEPKAVYVACDSPTPPVAVPVAKNEGKFAGVVTKSSMAVPRSSYKWVVKQVSPVMFDNLSTLWEPKQPRFGRLGRYDSGQRTLLVGEGDFSFSACLAAAFGDASNMVATSLDTFDFLRRNYKRAPDNIKELERRGCEVIHGVDATKMANHPRLCSMKFDRIIYNFPYWGFTIRKEPPEVQISYHRSLVSGFMANAKAMIDQDIGEIHITHKCLGFSKDWNIVQLGYLEGLDLAGVVEFRLQEYPGYRTKYGFGGDRNFYCHPSETYIFKLAHKKNPRKRHKNKRTPTLVS